MARNVRKGTGRRKVASGRGKGRKDLVASRKGRDARGKGTAKGAAKLSRSRSKVAKATARKPARKARQTKKALPSVRLDFALASGGEKLVPPGYKLNLRRMRSRF